MSDVTNSQMLESIGFAEQDKPDETPVDWSCSNCKAIVRGPREYNGVMGIAPWQPGQCPNCREMWPKWKLASEKAIDVNNDLKLEIIHEMALAMEKLGAQSDLLSIACSIGDTIDDGFALKALKEWNDLKRGDWESESTECVAESRDE